MFCIIFVLLTKVTRHRIWLFITKCNYIQLKACVPNLYKYKPISIALNEQYTYLPEKFISKNKKSSSIWRILVSSNYKHTNLVFSNNCNGLLKIVVF